MVSTFPPPVFKDTQTPSPFVETFPPEDLCAHRNALPDHIYMDCMGFGMGCSCLQVTFQGCDIQEACHLYDQLSIVCPIMVSLSKLHITDVFLSNSCRGYYSRVCLLFCSWLCQQRPPFSEAISQMWIADGRSSPAQLTTGQRRREGQRSVPSLRAGLRTVKELTVSCVCFFNM